MLVSDLHARSNWVDSAIELKHSVMDLWWWLEEGRTVDDPDQLLLGNVRGAKCGKAFRVATRTRFPFER